MATIIITTMNKKGKAKTFVYGKPVHLLAAASGTAAHVINNTSKLMGKTKEATKGLFLYAFDAELRKGGSEDE